LEEEMKRKKVLWWVAFGICIIVFILSSLFLVFKGTVTLEREGLGLIVSIGNDTKTIVATVLVIASLFGALIFGIRGG
jgi:hypothetical protein